MKRGITSLSQESIFNEFDEKEIKEILKKVCLMNSADVAKAVDWDIKKVSVYCKRGVLPDPIIYIGGRPIWARSQIESFIKRGGSK